MNKFWIILFTLMIVVNFTVLVASEFPIWYLMFRIIRNLAMIHFYSILGVFCGVLGLVLLHFLNNKKG